VAGCGGQDRIADRGQRSAVAARPAAERSRRPAGRAAWRQCLFKPRNFTKREICRLVRK